MKDRYEHILKDASSIKLHEKIEHRKQEQSMLLVIQQYLKIDNVFLECKIV